MTDDLIQRAQAWAEHQRYVGNLHLPSLPLMQKMYADKAKLVDDLLARIAAQEAEIARLRGLAWLAWREFNDIRARHGAPVDHYGMRLVDEGYWQRLTEALGDVNPERTPWLTPEAEAVAATLTPEARHD